MAKSIESIENIKSNVKSNFDYLKSDFYDYFGYDVSTKVYNSIYTLEAHIQMTGDKVNLFNKPEKLIGFRYISDLLHNAIYKKLYNKEAVGLKPKQISDCIRFKIESKYSGINNTLLDVNALGNNSAHASTPNPKRPNERQVLHKKKAVKILKEIRKAFEYVLEINKKSVEKFYPEIYIEQNYIDLKKIKDNIEAEIKEIKESELILDESLRLKMIELKEQEAKNILITDLIKEVTSGPSNILKVTEDLGNKKLTDDEIRKLKAIKNSVTTNKKRKDKLIADLEKQMEK